MAHLTADQITLKLDQALQAFNKALADMDMELCVDNSDKGAYVTVFAYGRPHCGQPLFHLPRRSSISGQDFWDLVRSDKMKPPFKRKRND